MDLVPVVLLDQRLQFVGGLLQVADQARTAAFGNVDRLPARGEEALLAVEESHGQIMAVSDTEIMVMQKRLASEGVWCEPASAAGAAGLYKNVTEGRMKLKGQTVVCVVTGHGLKDPDSVISQFAAPKVIPAELGALEQLIINSA